MESKRCPRPGCEVGLGVIKKGYFRISYNNQRVRRYLCKGCGRGFSFRSRRLDYRQKKPYLNAAISSLLCSGMTQRGVARHLGISRQTVERKFLFLSCQRIKPVSAVEELQFDELETIEHTKCKPLSVLVCVSGRGELLALRVAQMPSKGRLAGFSVKKYGPREDSRTKILAQTLSSLKISPRVIKTDAKASYGTAIKLRWPQAEHQIFNRAEKQRLQDRLHEKQSKKVFDPMFQLNHTCARLRADIRRLTRRSWCTTKRPDYLQKHLDIYLNHRLTRC